MGGSKIRRVLSRVKDQTSIGLAMVGNGTNAALDVAIVKATRHEEKPPLEKYLKDIATITSSSPAHVSTCVAMICRRLKKTSSWVVAVKVLILVHRLLTRGAPSYDHELFFFTTRRGERLLDMSDFLDPSVAVDFTVFVRTYARYLSEQLEFRVNGRLSLRGKRLLGGGEEKDNPASEMKTAQIFARARHLQELLERFLACRPTGKAKSHRVVLAALLSLVSESFDIYYHLGEMIDILIDRFMELEIPDCMKVLEIFCRAAKQFNEMDSFYTWCKSIGIARSSDYPLVETITPKKLMIMDEFIREKVALARARKVKKLKAFEEPEPDVKALPTATDSSAPEAVKKGEEDCNTQVAQELDLLDLSEDAEKGEGDDRDGLALALLMEDLTAPPPTWEAFGSDNEPSDWEVVLMQSINGISNEKQAVCGGLDTSVLDSLYQQGAMAGGAPFAVATEPTFLALPAPPVAGDGVQREDPFETSPAAYPEMRGVEREQQLMWQQYVNNGVMHGHQPYPMGGNPGFYWG